MEWVKYQWLSLSLLCVLFLVGIGIVFCLCVLVILSLLVLALLRLSFSHCLLHDDILNLRDTEDIFLILPSSIKCLFGI